MKPKLTLRRVQTIIEDLEQNQNGARHHISRIDKFHVYQEASSGKCMCLTRYRIILQCGNVFNSFTDFESWKILDPYCKHIETMNIDKALRTT